MSFFWNFFAAWQKMDLYMSVGYSELIFSHFQDNTMFFNYVAILCYVVFICQPCLSSLIFFVHCIALKQLKKSKSWEPFWSYCQNGPNALNWQCSLAGSSKTAPRILFFSIVLDAKYLSNMWNPLLPMPSHFFLGILFQS